MHGVLLMMVTILSRIAVNGKILGAIKRKCPEVLLLHKRNFLERNLSKFQLGKETTLKFGMVYFVFDFVKYLIGKMRFCIVTTGVAICFICSSAMQAQYNNVWVFGNTVGIDFNKVPPELLTTKISSLEAAASICDATGKLLFYTDGNTIWDASHNVMLNGNDLPGLSENITWSTAQGTLIVPIPGKDNLYYVFSLGARESVASGQLFYCMVDMTLNNGMGAVVVGTKGKRLAIELTEHMTAISGDNCNIWLVVCKENPPPQNFYSYRINFNGIDTIPIVSDKIHGGGFYYAGYLHASPDRTKIAVTHGNLVMYDFDTSTGRISNPFVLEAPLDPCYLGVAFSPDNSKLYATTAPERNLFQYDIGLRDSQRIIESEVKLKALDSNNWLPYLIKMAPDGKMYISNVSASVLSAINKPNLAGMACEYIGWSFDLRTSFSNALPNSGNIVRNKKNYTTQRDTVHCEDSVVLSALNSDAVNYRWQDGSLGKTFNPDSSGTYWVTYQNYTTECEDYVDTFHLVFYKNKRIYSSAVLDGMCKADTLLLKALHSSASPYIWNDNVRGRERVVNSRGTYWVNYRIDSLCESYADTFIVRYPERDYELSFMVDTLFCAGDPVVLRNTSEEPFTDFRWTYGDGNGSTVRTPPQYSYTSSGRYEVKLVGWIRDRCADSVITYITVDSVFPLSLRTDRDEICVGESVNFYPETDGTTLALRWQFDDQESMTTFNGTYYQHAYAYPGTILVQLTAHNRVCPDVEITDTIQVYDLPHIDLGADSSLCWQGQPIILENKAFLPEGNYRYQWSTGDTISALRVYHHGTYSLTVTQKPIGCSNSESIVIAKDCYIDIPNAFTPNGDGENDYFFPRQLLSISVTAFRMQVFNRWGQVIFETTSINGKGWDGRFNGKEQPMGVYVYRIDVNIDDKQEHYQGNVTLLR